MSVFHLYLIVLSALLAMLAATESSPAAAAETGTATSNQPPSAEMKQLLLADVNQATDQQEMPASRFVRQLGNGRRFGGGGFGRRRPFRGGGLPFGGGGGGFGGGGGRRLFGGRRRGPGFGFFG